MPSITHLLLCQLVAGLASNTCYYFANLGLKGLGMNQGLHSSTDTFKFYVLHVYFQVYDDISDRLVPYFHGCLSLPRFSKVAAEVVQTIASSRA